MTLKAKKTSRDAALHKQEALEEVTKEETKRLNVDVPASLHQKVKMLAAQQNTSITEIIIICLNEYLSKSSNDY